MKKGPAWKNLKEQWLVILVTVLLAAYLPTIISWFLARIWPVHFSFGQFNLPNLTFILISGLITIVAGLVGFYLGMRFVAWAVAQFLINLVKSTTSPELRAHMAQWIREDRLKRRQPKPNQISRRAFLSPWRKPQAKTASAEKPPKKEDMSQ